MNAVKFDPNHWTSIFFDPRDWTVVVTSGDIDLYSRRYLKGVRLSQVMTTDYPIAELESGESLQEDIHLGFYNTDLRDELLSRLIDKGIKCNKYSDDDQITGVEDLHIDSIRIKSGTPMSTIFGILESFLETREVFPIAL